MECTYMSRVCFRVLYDEAGANHREPLKSKKLTNWVFSFVSATQTSFVYLFLAFKVFSFLLTVNIFRLVYFIPYFLLFFLFLNLLLILSRLRT
jgi:hypothetical protein